MRANITKIFALSFMLAAVAALIPSLFPLHGNMVEFYYHGAASEYIAPCKIIDINTGFPFSVFNYYSPGCPPNYTLSLYVRGLLANLFIFLVVVLAFRILLEKIYNWRVA